MKKKAALLFMGCAVSAFMLTGCGAEPAAPAPVEQVEEDTSAADEAKAAEDEAAKKAEEERLAEEARIAEEKEILQLVSDGVDYLHGANGKEYDPSQALACFEEAETKGNTDAAFLAGYVLDFVMHGGDDGNDYKKALTYYEKCEDENPYAKAAIGYLYKNGDGVDIDDEKGTAILAEAASSIDADTLLTDTETVYAPEAKYIVAELYYDGVYDEEANYEKTLEFLDAAGQVESAAIYDKIGYMYLNGIGVEEDYTIALENYQKSAELNDMVALNQIGYMYKHGYGLEQDYEKALEYYERSAALGYGTAYNNIAFMYDVGDGVEQDYAKAIEYYEIAVEKNDGYACDNLGYLYQMGYGVEQDYKKAAELYEAGAELGHAASMKDLGYMYYCGYGVETSLEKAKEYFKEAAILGNEQAQKYCDELGVSWE